MTRSSPPPSSAPNKSASRPVKRGLWGELVYGVLPWILGMMVVRCLVFSPFNIPSGSMIPTLQIGDFVIVSKFSYGFSKFSLPFAPDLFEGRIFASLPHRGDVAVFRYTRDTSVDYIKRIVGLPGDRIQMRQGQLYINDALVPRKSVGPYSFVDENGRKFSGERFLETLPGSAGSAPVRHDILTMPDEENLTDESTDVLNPNNTPIYVVPEGYFFAMGDDRDDSADSRFQNDLGYVPLVNLVGHAQFVFFSIDLRHPGWEIWYWPSEIRWSRLFHGIG